MLLNQIDLPMKYAWMTSFFFFNLFNMTSALYVLFSSSYEKHINKISLYFALLKPQSSQVSSCVFI